MALNFLQKLNIFGRYKVEQPINVLTTAQYTQRNKKLLKKDFVSWYKTNPFVFWAIQERAKAVSNVKFYYKENGELSEEEFRKVKQNLIRQMTAEDKTSKKPADDQNRLKPE